MSCVEKTDGKIQKNCYSCKGTLLVIFEQEPEKQIDDKIYFLYDICAFCIAHYCTDCYKDNLVNATIDTETRQIIETNPDRSKPMKGFLLAMCKKCYHERQSDNSIKPKTIREEEEEKEKKEKKGL